MSDERLREIAGHFTDAAIEEFMKAASDDDLQKLHPAQFALGLGYGVGFVLKRMELRGMSADYIYHALVSEKTSN